MSKQIFIKNLRGNSTTLDIEGTETVAELKWMIEEWEGIPGKEQRLVFAGKELNEERALSDYNIKKGSTIHLVLRLRGGSQI